MLKVVIINTIDRPGYTPRPSLVILAVDEADAVRAAGGFIFDRVKAGWAALVILEACQDHRPLQILGIRPAEIVVAEGFEDTAEWPNLIVASEDVYHRNAKARRKIIAASRHRTELAIWGIDWPTGLKSGIGPVEHRLSSAARIFKGHAMCAIGPSPADVSATEAFHGGRHWAETSLALQPPRSAASS